MPLGAQQQAPPRRTGTDSTADSTARKRRVLTAADTIKAPTATPVIPVVTSTGVARLSWSRDELFAAGALTLGELVAQVPGVTRMTTGFMMAPEALAWHGNPGGVKIFVDGIERDEIAPRAGGVTDFSLIPIWALEQVTVEETAMLLRVHARTWRITRTTPTTRVDVSTGSENINLFRGFFGRRASNGAVIQLAAQQLSTASIPGLDGSALGAFARVGWAGGPWSIDGTLIRQGLDRTAGIRYPLTDPVTNAIPPYKGSSSLAYLRLAWGSPDSGRAWVHLTAASEGAVLTHRSATTSPTGVAADSADTASSRNQFRVAAGVRRGALRLSGDVRSSSGAGVHGVGGRALAEWSDDRTQLASSVFRTIAGGSGWDARGAFAARPWFRLSASAGSAPAGIDSTAAHFGAEADVAVQMWGRWVRAGVVRASALAVAAPIGLDTAMRNVAIPAGTGVLVGFDGPLAYGFRLHTDAINWNGATTYRPQTEVNSRVYVDANMADRYPQAKFRVLAALTHQYRTAFYVPQGADGLGQSAAGYSVIGTLLEIRIASAVISWQYRDIPGTSYYTFPGYLMPRITSVYGVRWEFWN